TRAMASPPPPYTTDPHHYHSIEQQQTIPIPAAPVPLISPIEASSPSMVSTSKRTFKRILPIAIGMALVIVMYFVWNPPTSPTAALPSTGSSVTQQNFGNGSTSTTKSSTGSGDIQVYVVGVVKHLGVYTIQAWDRFYQCVVCDRE